MKMRLNLATSPLESDRRFIVGSAALCILGVAAMAVLGWYAYGVWRTNIEVRSQQAQLDADMSRLQSQRRELELFFNRADTVQQRDLAAFLNGLIAQRAFPWTKIFMDLENNLPRDARVVSVEPTLEGDHVQLRVTVEALSDAAKLEFLRALERSTEFSQIQLLSEKRLPQPADTNPIVLSLLARYSVI